jgi:hypothetical protein
LLLPVAVLTALHLHLPTPQTRHVCSVIAGEKVTINPLQMVVILIIQPLVINGNGAEE